MIKGENACRYYFLQEIYYHYPNKKMFQLLNANYIFGQILTLSH